MTRSFLLIVAALPFQDPGAPTAPHVDQLVLAGRYAEVARPVDDGDAHALAAWAFARHHLAFDSDVLQAATTAHEAGEPLGSYVLLRCLRRGEGVRRDRAREARINHALRVRLAAIEEPSPFELLALAATTPADLDGVVREATWQQTVEQRTGWLTAAADAGFAQAADLLGEQAQAAGDPIAARRWFTRAAKAGLASGMKNLGFLQLQGVGGERDEEAAAVLTRRAAEAGDCFAMINMAAMHERRAAGSADGTQARTWIDRAAASGHWLGALEKSLALRTGSYGYEPDGAAADALLAQAASSRCGDVLMRIAALYARGVGLRADAERARAIGEAAYVQGCEEAAEMLAWLHAEDRPGLPADEDAAAFWLMRSKGMPDDHAVGARQRALRDRLRTLDPFAIGVLPDEAAGGGERR